MRNEEERLFQKQRWFKRGQRFRAGIEGRINVLKHQHRMERCFYHGEIGMRKCVLLAAIGSNLKKIARQNAKSR